MAYVVAIVADGMTTSDGMILIMVDVIAFVVDGMATGSIIYLILFIILFYFVFWGVEQNLIPYVRQMVFVYISV